MTEVIPPNTSAIRTALCYALLTLATVGVFAPTVTFNFVDYDDIDMAAQNPLLHPATMPNLAQIWHGPYREIYAPLSYSLWWLVSKLGIDSPGMLHGLNILLHTASTLLIFSILRRCVANRFAAFLGAAVFALHPIQVESVAWIAEMNNLLAGVFSMAALRFYLGFAGSETQWGRKYIAATVCFALALLAKPTAMVVPPIAIALDAAALGTPLFTAISRALPWLYLDLPAMYMAHHSQGGIVVPLEHRPLVAADAIGFYLTKILWPVHFLIDYGRTPLRVWEDRTWGITRSAVAGCAGLLISLILLIRHRKAPKLTAASVIFLCGLLPILGLIPFSLQHWSTVADHFVYLAMIGVALAIASTAARSKILSVMLLIVVGLLGWRCVTQVLMWQDTQTLAHHTLEVDPMSTVANKIAGHDLNRNQDWSAAIPYFQNALVRNPNSGELHYDLARALQGSAQLSAAIEEYHTAIAELRGADKVTAMTYLAGAYMESGNADGARDEYREALRLDPNRTEARAQLQLLSPDVP